jgi:hypothetical protein
LQYAVVTLSIQAFISPPRHPCGTAIE